MFWLSSTEHVARIVHMMYIQFIVLAGTKRSHGHLFTSVTSDKVDDIHEYK